MGIKYINNTDVVGNKFTVGEAVIGEHAVHSGYYGLWNTEAIVGTTGQYMIISSGTDTFVNGDNVYIRAGNNSQTNQVKLSTSGGLTVGGNRVLTVADEGSGNGLDADTLDGQHSSAFLTSYTETDTLATVTGRGASTTTQLFFDAGFDSHPIMLSGSQNFDNIDRSGFYNLYNTHNSSTNSPGFHYGTMIAIGNDKGSSGFGLQIAHERTGAGMYVRGMNDSGSTWYDWDEIWTSGTHGSGSGLDADTLDSYEASAFPRKAEDAAITGNYDFSGTGLTLSSHFYTRRYDANGNVYFHVGTADSVANILNLRVYDASNAVKTLVLNGGTGAISWNGNTILTTADEGSGNGIDADTVDGIQGASFARSDASDTLSGVYTFSSTSTSPTLFLSGHAGASNYNYFLNAYNDGGSRAVHFVNGTTRTADGGANTYTIRNDGGSLRLGNANYTTLLVGSGDLTYNANEVWHAGNDGSGSTLDADLLDGVQGSSFLRSDEADTAGGTSMYVFDKPSTSSYQTALRVGTEGGGLYLTSDNAIIGKGAYYNNGWIATATSGSAIDFTTNEPKIFSHSGATVGSAVTMSSSYKIFHENYHPTADQWTTARTVTFSGDVTGSFTTSGANDSSCTLTVANDSHTHDDRYYTETESDARFLRGDTSDAMAGRLTLDTGGTNTYGIVAGYGNDHHMMVMRGAITTGQSTLAITAAHQMTFVEHANDANEGWYFVSKASGNYTEMARIDGVGQMYIGGDKVWHQGNDGTGSGLDADTVDGIEADALVQTTGNQTISGTKEFASSSLVVKGTHGTISFIDTTSDADDFYLHVNSNNFYVLVDRDSTNTVDGAYESPHPLQLEGDTNTAYTFGNRILTTADEGTGNSLDADTVDGFHVDANAGGLVKSYQDVTTTFHSGVSGYRSSMGMVYASDGPNSGNDWYRFIQPSYREGSGGTNVWQTQLAFYGTGGDFWLRQREGGNHGSSGWGSWHRVWTSNSDGSGSGLDADTLDGVEGASFLRSDANDTASGDITFTGSTRHDGGLYFVGDSNMGFVPYPVGGQFRSDSSSHTGYILIKLPTDVGANPDDMMSFYVDIYDYSTGEMISVYVGGYIYTTSLSTSNYWYNCTAIITSKRTDKDFNVRFGNDGTNYYVAIGETNTTWAHPSVVVRDFQCSFRGQSSHYVDGWSISISTSTLSGVDETQSTNYPVSQQWKTARTITLGGDLSGSVSIDGSADVTLTATVADDSHDLTWDNIDGETANSVNDWGGLRHQTNDGYIDFGPANTSWAHIYTDRPAFYTNKDIYVNNSRLLRVNNEGSGGGIDADTVDALHASSFLRSDTHNSLYRVTAGNGNRIRFWDSDSYAIWMSSATDGTWGGRVPGETTSDYNMYFRMTSGTNRGFVFQNSTTEVAGIDGAGNIRAIADVIAYSSSDKTFKDELKVIENPLDKIKNINGYNFTWNDKQTTYESGKKDIGVVAQEIEKVLPEIVNTREDGSKAVKYDKIVALLIEGIKELKDEVEELKNKCNDCTK